MQWLNDHVNKYDVLLSGAIILIALVWFIINVKTADNGAYVSVYVDNIFIGKYDLSGDIEQAVTDNDGREIQRFVIKNGSANVISASCPDKLCMHQKPISKSGETIVCLPNKIVLKIEADEPGDTDDAGGGIDAVAY